METHAVETIKPDENVKEREQGTNDAQAETDGTSESKETSTSFSKPQPKGFRKPCPGCGRG